MSKRLLTFFHQNISVYAIFNDENYNDTLTNDIISFEQLGPDFFISTIFECSSYSFVR